MGRNPAYILCAISPAFINFFAMLGNMITRGRWVWFAVTMILTFAATAAYYFSEYRNEEDGI